jgi:hypothetical protein
MRRELAVAASTDVQIKNAEGKLEETIEAVEEALEA